MISLELPETDLPPESVTQVHVIHEVSFLLRRIALARAENLILLSLEIASWDMLTGPGRLYGFDARKFKDGPDLHAPWAYPGEITTFTIHNPTDEARILRGVLVGFGDAVSDG
jgi:hypothetical protein